MDGRFNTVAGWVLGAGIVLLGTSLVTAEVFKSGRPEKMGYPIEGVVEEGAGEAEAELPIAHYLQTADAAAGEGQFRKCAACHTINQGGANGLGPNLFGTMGATVAHVAGFEVGLEDDFSLCADGSQDGTENDDSHSSTVQFAMSVG